MLWSDLSDTSRTPGLVVRLKRRMRDIRNAHTILLRKSLNLIKWTYFAVRPLFLCYAFRSNISVSRNKRALPLNEQLSVTVGVPLKSARLSESNRLVEFKRRMLPFRGGRVLNEGITRQYYVSIKSRNVGKSGPTHKYRPEGNLSPSKTSFFLTSELDISNGNVLWILLFNNTIKF